MIGLNNKSRNKGHKVLKVILCLLAVIYISDIVGNYIVAQQLNTQNKPIIKPQVPEADRYQKNKVFLEYADELEPMKDSHLISKY